MRTPKPDAWMTLTLSTMSAADLTEALQSETRVNERVWLQQEIDRRRVARFHGLVDTWASQGRRS